MALNLISQEEAIDKAVHAIKEGHSLRFSGPCGSGKTTLCKKILTNGDLAQDLREGKAFMLTSRRPVADEISLEIARTQPYLCDSRPVKTANALAFWVLKRANPDVRLLDVTSQTKLITDIIQSHIKHVENEFGDGNCQVCEEMNEYVNAVGSDFKKGTTTARAFEKVFLTVAFITRLREAFARFDELGIKLGNNALQDYEEALGTYNADELGNGKLSWHIVQSLRKEYRSKVRSTYGDNFFDNSSMLNEAAAKVHDGKCDLPKVVIVDDCQDLNLAAYDFLREMHCRNVPIIFVGNDDESVQGYKGAMPDVLSILEVGDDFNCESYCLAEEGNVAEKLSKSGFVRGISNNIGSWFVWGLPTPNRPGKPYGDISKGEECFEYWKLNSEEEELDRLTHEISDYMFGSGEDNRNLSRHWRDLAVVSNENAFLHKVGERLKANRIPFKYTSVNEEPIKDSLVVEAMLSLMKLAYYASLGEKACEEMGSGEVFSLIKNVISSPLFQIEDEKAAANFEIASRIFASILNVLNQGGEEEKAEFSDFKSWEMWKGAKDKDLNAFFAFLLINSEFRKKVIGKIEPKAGADSRKKCLIELGFRTTSLAHLFDLVDEAKKDVEDIPQLFWDLWDVAWFVKGDKGDSEKKRKWERKNRPEVWQNLAFDSTEASSDVNEWLDQLIRLQHLAQIGPDGENVPEFVYRVCSASIDSDSLAHVAPKDEAVTLSSPVGVESERFAKVWVPDAQENVWNKLLMEDLFFTRLLAAIVTNERIKKACPERIPEKGSIQDRFSEEEEFSNLRSLLTAASRSNGKTVFLAVEDEEHTPLFCLGSLNEERQESDNPGEQEDRVLKDLELRSDSLSGMSDYCRVVLIKAIEEGDEERAQDAACALKLLSQKVETADPAFWNFIQRPDPREFVKTYAPAEGTVTLNPSKVDSLWGTPVPSILQDNRYLGPTKSEGQMQFGTMVHACAQWATEEGLDQIKVSSTDRVEAAVADTAEKLMQKFGEEEECNTDLTPLEKMTYRRRAEKAMKNLANYFVNTSQPAKTGCPVASMPALVKAEAEKWISSSFTLEEVFDLVRNTEALRDKAVTEEDFIEALEKLGHFTGLEYFKGKTIRLTGKIDRLEEREGDVHYVVDYKTGSSHCGNLKDFSDLQLLCYQLLLYFPGETRNCEGAEKVPWKGKVVADKSMLFSVEKEPYPASARDKKDTEYSYGSGTAKKSSYERYFQPCIFKEGGLNDEVLSECQGKSSSEKKSLMGEINIPESDNPILQSLRELVPVEDENPSLLPWVFYMLSKFFYAVRYVDSAHFDLREEREKGEEAKEERDRMVETMTIYGLGE